VDKKVNYWMRRYITVPLVNILLRLGTTRKAWIWKTVYTFSPYLAGFCTLMEDSQKPENILLWYWQEGDPEEDTESVELTLSDIDEMIRRAPVPLGGDDFLIMIRQFGVLYRDNYRYDFSRNDDIERFLKSHPLVGAWDLPGNRWKDWKKGPAKKRLRNILILAEPKRLAPLTMICVIVVGRAVARSIFVMQGKSSST
jgi:hypothetical protein